jgi:hypothetical protein
MVSRIRNAITFPIDYRARERRLKEVDEKLHVDSDSADHVHSSETTLVSIRLHAAMSGQRLPKCY